MDAAHGGGRKQDGMGEEEETKRKQDDSGRMLKMGKQKPKLAPAATFKIPFNEAGELVAKSALSCPERPYTTFNRNHTEAITAVTSKNYHPLTPNSIAANNTNDTNRAHKHKGWADVSRHVGEKGHHNMVEAIHHQRAGSVPNLLDPKWVNNNKAMISRVRAAAEMMRTGTIGAVVEKAIFAKAKGLKLRYCEKALGFLDIKHPIRRAAIWIIEALWFEYFILLLIAANCVLLALLDPTKPPQWGRNGVLRRLEDAFTGVYAIEMILKITALGLMRDKRCYLRDNWNVLDFTVTNLGLISLLPFFSGNVAAIRVVRILRPLRTISVLPGMRVLVGAMIKSLPMLANVFLVLVVLCAMFGILGVQIFGGVLRNRCYGDNDTTLSTATASNFSLVGMEFKNYVPPGYDVVDVDRVCTNSTTWWAGHHCNATLQQAMVGESYSYHSCQARVCLPYANPESGAVNFDNMLYASLNLFQVFTLQGWSGIMYECQDGTSGWAFIYFLFLVFIGGFFLVNLALAVIYEVYELTFKTQRQAAHIQRMLQEQKAAAEKRDHALREIERIRQEDFAAEQAELEKELGADVSNSYGYSRHNRTKRTLSSCALFVRKRVAKWFHELRRVCKTIDDSPLFSPMIMGGVLLNAISLSMAYYGMPKAYSDALNNINLTLTVLFAIEMAIKLLALGFREYLRDKFHVFDGLVVVTSFIELALASHGSLTSLRVLRVLRFMKLMRQWPSLQKFLMNLWNAVLELGNLTLIVIILLFVYALLGMQLFGGKMNFPEGLPRHNFDTFFWASITDAVMHDGMRAAGRGVAIYFVSLVALGNWLILNLFIAILLSNFAAEDPSQSSPSSPTWTRMKSVLTTAVHRAASVTGRLPSQTLRRFSMTSKRKEEGGKSNNSLNNSVDQTPNSSLQQIKTTTTTAAAMSPMPSGKQAPPNSPTTPQHKEPSPALLGWSGRQHWKGMMSVRLECYEGRSCKLFPVDGKFRRTVFDIVDDKRFELAVLAVVLVCCGMLAYETPAVVRNGNSYDILRYMDIGVTIFFALECVFKIIAMGLVRNKGAYLREPWDMLDFTIVLLSVTSLVLSGFKGSSSRAFRLIRVLRPIRVINLVPELRLITSALFHSLPALAHVLFVSLVIWLIFAIFGMQLFMGKFFYCTDESVEYEALCVGPGREWVQPRAHFNNIGSTMLTLYQMSTTEGWTDVMYNGIDAVGVARSPRRDAHIVVALYFVVFMVFSCFFLVNVFVGIIINNFSALRQNSTNGSVFLTPEQKAWVEMYRKALRFKPHAVMKRPRGAFRKRLYKFMVGSHCENAMIGLVVCNTVVMCLHYYNEPTKWSNTLERINLGFAVVFVIEAVTRLYAYYPAAFFREATNVFDLVVSVGALIGQALVPHSAVVTVLRLFRVIRLCRILRLKGLHMLFVTLIVSLPTLLNVSMLLLLLFFVYAVLSMQACGSVVSGTEIGPHANFKNIGISMLTLLRMSTGEGWNDIMYDCMYPTPDMCDPEVQTCGTKYAPLLFVTFYIAGSFIMLNLLVAVVLENFSISRADDEKQVTFEHVELFTEAWQTLDPKGTNFIPVNRFETLVRKLPPPLGLRGRTITRRDFVKFASELVIPQQGGYLCYQDVLQVLTRHAMGVKVEELPASFRQEMSKELREKRREAVDKWVQRQQMLTQIAKSFRHRLSMRRKSKEMRPPAQSPDGKEEEDVPIAHAYSAALIQAAIRGHLERKRLRSESDVKQQRKEQATRIANHIIDLLSSAQEVKRKTGPNNNNSISASQHGGDPEGVLGPTDPVSAGEPVVSLPGAPLVHVGSPVTLFDPQRSKPAGRALVDVGDDDDVGGDVVGGVDDNGDEAEFKLRAAASLESTPSTSSPLPPITRVSSAARGHAANHPLDSPDTPKTLSGAASPPFRENTVGSRNSNRGGLDGNSRHSLEHDTAFDVADTTSTGNTSTTLHAHAHTTSRPPSAPHDADQAPRIKPPKQHALVPLPRPFAAVDDTG
eukprot:jgi/Chlat1/602/Chrsp103S00955